MSDSFFERMWRSVQGIKDESLRLRALSILVQHVPEHFFWEAFVVVQAISDTSALGIAEAHVRKLMGEKQVDALEVLVARVPERFFAQCWEAVSAIQGEWRKAGLQVLLAMRVPETYFPLVWQTMLKTKDTWLQVTLLEALAPRVPERFFAQFWETVKEPKFRHRQQAILKTLIPHLAQPYLAEVLDAIKSLPYPKGRIEMLEEVLPYLSAEQSERVLETLLPPSQLLIPPDEAKASGQQTWLRGRQALHITRLACRLPEQRFLEYLPMLLQTVRLTPVDEDRVGMLTPLAARIPEQTLPDLMELLWNIETPGGREEVLAALLPTLKPDGWTKALELTTARALETGDVHILIQCLRVAGTLPQQPSPALLYPALHTTLHLLAHNTRREAMADLAPLAAIVCALGSDTAGSEACCAVLEVGSWWP